MVNQLLTIAEAAGLVNKSAQTIRRLIKNGAVKARRKRTPQGFNYMVDKASLMESFGLMPKKKEITVEDDIIEEDMEEVEEQVEAVIEEDNEPEIYVLDPGNEDDFEEAQKIEEEEEPEQAPAVPASEDNTNYANIVEKLIDQHQADKEKLYGLVEAFQNRVVTLEEQIKQLQAPPKKKWWQIW